MAKIYVDTTKIKDNGLEILGNVEKYKKNINDLFDRISNVPTQTYEWVGKSSNDFVKEVIKEKEDYINFGDGLNNLGTELGKYADSLEKAIVELDIK